MVELGYITKIIFQPPCIPVPRGERRGGKGESERKGKQDKRNSFGILRLVEFCSKSSGRVGVPAQ